MGSAAAILLGVGGVLLLAFLVWHARRRWRAPCANPSRLAAWRRVITKRDL